ncbi:MAG: serine/threonine protein kinase [Gemmataceae bacterium]|nr:serine/threonine protein kinase [Gemmataceae bacterium]
MTEHQDSLEVLAEDFLARIRAGESVSIEQYALANPARADEIRKQFAALLKMEGLRVAEPPVPLPIPERLGEYRILREIGRGGMGVVYEAVQETLVRHFALKVLPPEMAPDAQRLERFRREARAAARLHHTNIIPVFGVGSDGGLHYFAMQFIRGEPLDRIIRELKRIRTGEPVAPDHIASLVAQQLVTSSVRTGLPDQATSDARPAERDSPSATSGFLRTGEAHYYRQVAQIGRQVADALAYAHDQGVLHRDIKPSNVVLDLQGIAWVADFGLARTDDDAILSVSGGFLGTYRYAPPERLDGVSDAKGDVYSLGVTLYELLTTEPAFAARDTPQLVDQLRNSSVPAARTVDRRIPPDLDTIVRKATAREPRDRYATAREMADDLERFLSGEPILARRQNAFELAWSWAKRRPAAAVLGLVLGLLPFVALLATLSVNARLNEKQGKIDVANQELTVASNKLIEVQRELDNRGRQITVAEQRIGQLSTETTKANEEAVTNRSKSQFVLANAYWQDGRVVDARDQLSRIPTRHRHWEWHYCNRLFDGGYATLRGHSAAAICVAFHPDGTRLATGSLDGTVRIWDARTGAELLTLQDPLVEYFTCLAFSPDGTRLATGSNDSMVRVWDARSGEVVLAFLGHRASVTSVAFSPDGTTLATGSEDRTARLWDLRSGKERYCLRGHSERVSSIAFSPDGSLLATASFDKTTVVWSLRTGTKQFGIRGHADRVNSVAYSPDGTRLATSSNDQTVKVWDSGNGTGLLTLRGHADSVFSVAFSPDGTRLASGSFDRMAKLWDTGTGEAVLTFRGHSDAVFGLSFSPDGNRLATVSLDRTAKFWDLRAGTEQGTLRGHADRISSVANSPDGTRVVSGSDDQTVKIWNVRTQTELFSIRGHTGNVNSVAYSPDGKHLASASDDGTARLWDNLTGSEQTSFRGHTGGINCVAFGPDGLSLATASADRTVKIWDTRTATERQTLRGHSDVAYCVAYSPDGLSLATASADNTVKIWDTRSGKEKLTLRGHIDGVTSVAYHPAGTQLATGSLDSTAKLWDAQSGAELKTLLGHTDRITSVAFSPDGTRLATASLDKTAKLWDPKTGTEWLTFRGHADMVFQAIFSPDGTRLITGALDRAVKFWDARVGQELITFRGHSDIVLCAAFSSNHSQLATCSNDGLVKLWDARTGAELFTLRGNSERVVAVAYSPDGRLVAGRTKAGEVLVWNAQSGQLVPFQAPPAWLKPGHRNNPPAGTFVEFTSTGTFFLVRPTPLDEWELGLREAKARPDPWWHLDQFKAAAERNDTFAARFHYRHLVTSVGMGFAPAGPIGLPLIP